MQTPDLLDERPAPLLGLGPLPLVEVSGPAHRVRRANDAFCQLVHTPRENLLGRAFVELVANADACASRLDLLRQSAAQTPPRPALENASSSETPTPCCLHARWPSPQGGDAPPVDVIIQLDRPLETHLDIAAMNEALLIGALRQHELRVAAEIANEGLHTEVAERERARRTLQEAQSRLRAETERLEAAVAERTTHLRASLAQLEAFSYTLAHDLRAPVRAIHGYVQLALDTADAEAWPGTPWLHRISLAAIRMEELIQDVLTLNRVASQPMQTAPIDVEALVRVLLAERPELGPDVADIRVESPLPPMLGHEPTFRQCLVNLLDNAVKFVAPGARPEVLVRAEMIAAKNNAPGPARVRLWIEDQGIGIAPEHRARIFELFQRLHPHTRYEGTGIGLAIVQKGLHRMGGSVGLEPGQPRGSRFWIELPAT